MAEATTVTYNVIHSVYGIKDIIVKYGNLTTADTLTLTGYASISVAMWLHAVSASGLVVASVSIASNVITFGQTSGTGSGFVRVLGT